MGAIVGLNRAIRRVVLAARDAEPRHWSLVVQLMSRSECPGCGVVLDAVGGVSHAYIESSPACWALYGEVLAREYTDPAYRAVHRLTVDAYAVQHPGQPSPRSTQSVAVHLVALHLVLEQGFPPEVVTRALRTIVVACAFTWLAPPPSRGALTVAHARPAASADDHAKRVHAWARAAWDAWSPHHAEVRRWAAVLR